MAAGSLLTLLDDIATILDDVAVMSKTAAAKTAGVLGDDLALNAQQVSGVVAKRELPVVWAVAKGSFVNKLILVPLALAISAVAPWAVTPLLMIGGLYLCFEGSEKLAHHFFRKVKKSADEAQAEIKALAEGRVDEKAKIKGAIRTDFVLSAEIIAITLGTVAEAGFTTQLLVLSIIAVLMTIGVYGLVACIVKLDDLGLLLSQRPRAISRKLGQAILRAAPVLMKTLSIAGTAAMFLVGGGILTHGVPRAHHWVAHAGEMAGQLAAVGGALEMLVPALLNGVFGLAAGTAALLVWSGIGKLRGTSH